MMVLATGISHPRIPRHVADWVGAVEKIEIKSTSKHSATCSDILIRDGDQVRLLFRPEIVDNPTHPVASLRGHFLYRRKGRTEKWTDFDKVAFSSLKKGEGYQLSLSSGELYILLRDLVPLYRFSRREGVPQGRVELLKVDRILSELLPLAEPDLLAFLSAQGSNATQALRVVLQWLSRQADAQELIDDGGELPELNSLVGLANLRSVLGSWSANATRADEEFWQDLLARHSYVLSQLFAYPIVLIKGKAYVGGKDLSNTGGNVVDFLFRKESSGAAVLVEIKTPETRLLGSEYRSGIFPPSADLSGAISQVLGYSESLSAEFHSLRRADECLTAAQPSCVVILGNAQKELSDDPRKRSFERFRERLVGVQVLTFDELFQRVQRLVRLLEGAG
jgi:Domain of unknown function (DUF4263)